MRIIVDTNRILSALLSDGLSRKIITSKNFDFYTLDYVHQEIQKYMGYIKEKSGLSENEINTLICIFMENITILSDEELNSKMDEAKDIMKDIDIKDASILACALAIPNDGIWTEDKHFQKQKRVKVWRSIELLRYI